MRTISQTVNNFMLTVSGGGKLITTVLLLAFTAATATTTFAQTYSILHNFSGSSDGKWPTASLTLVGSTLYGTTEFGGSSDEGTIFAMNPDGTGFTVLHNFGNVSSDGSYPLGSLTLVGSTLYGTTVGGSSGTSTVFAININGTGYTILHTFAGSPSDGASPRLLTLVGSMLYGCAASGGSNNLGTVFAMNTDGTGYTILHNFGSIPSDGAQPNSLTLVASTLYGTTAQGGVGNGTVFTINTNGTGYTILHNFGSIPSDGTHPESGLTLAGSKLYGTTFLGGTSGEGTVFAINTNGTGYTILHNFAGFSMSDGVEARASLTLVGSKLYGTTWGADGVGYGTVFVINTNGTGYTILHYFGSIPNDGALPDVAPLTLVGSNLYGTTNQGGSNNLGTVFMLSLPSPIIGLSGILTFGSVPVGASAQQTLTITNSGNAVLNVSSISYPTGFTGSWSGSIAPSGSHNVTVTFTPTDAASYGGTVTVISDATSGSSTIDASGTGVCAYGISPPSGVFTAGGGTNTFAVSTTSLCPWTAAPSDSWVSILTGSSGTGSGTVTYAVAPNATSNARTNVVSVASQTFTVTQIGNVAPQVSITAVSPITLPVATVNLNATVTDDGAPYGTLTTTWSKVSGVGSVTFGNPNSANTTATFSTNGTYVLRLTASDGAVSTSDDVTVIVTMRPAIISAPTAVSNVLLQVGNVAVVPAMDPIPFTVGAFDADGNPLNCQWVSCENVTNTDCDPVYVFSNCGPCVVSVTITDNVAAAVSSNCTVTVPCLLNITKLQPKLNFAKTNADSCTVKGAFLLPAGYSFSNKLATLDIGGAEVSFVLGSKGTGRNGLSTFSKPSYNKKTLQWKFSATLKNGSWQTSWAEYGMVNTNTPKQGVLVTNFPVILVVDTEAFMGTTNLHYTAKYGKSGTAK